MGLRIATNLPSLNAQKNLYSLQRDLKLRYAQLASGSRITKAADDAAGLAVSENLKADIRGFHQAHRNAEDGISMVQVAEGGMQQISNMLIRLRELAVQASSDTIGKRERGFINMEVHQLKNEIQRIAVTSRFGDRKLLDGSGDKYDFQVGIDNDKFADRISFDAGKQNLQLSALGIEGVDFDSKEGAQEALSKLDHAQNVVNSNRATLGALQNRLVSTIENLSTESENFAAANSRIRDTNIAEASAQLAKDNVLQAASVSILSQANQAPNVALKLLS